MNPPDYRQYLSAIVEGGPDRIKNAAEGLDAADRTKLLNALLDTFGEDRVTEAVASLAPGKATKVFEGCVRGLVADRASDDKDAADLRLLNAVKALDEGHARRLLLVLGRGDAGRLLEAAAKALSMAGSSVRQDLGLETEDVLRRVRADGVRVVS